MKYQIHLHNNNTNYLSEDIKFVNTTTKTNSRTTEANWGINTKVGNTFNNTANIKQKLNVQIF